MSKLVDKERLAKLAKALDDRAKVAVAAEKERALAAEQAIEAKADANAAAIAAINHEETGLLKKAKDHAQGLVDGEKERAEEQEGLLADRIETLEGIVGGEAEGAFGEVKEAVAENTAAIAKLNGGADEEGSVAKAVADAVKAEEDRAKEVEGKLDGRIAANEAFVAAQPAIDAEQDRRLGVLEGLISGGEGDDNALTQLQKSIDAAQAAADKAQGEVDAVEVRMEAAEGEIDQLQIDVARLDGADNVEGSVKKQIKDAITAVNQAADGLAGRVGNLETFRDVTYPAAEAKVREDFAAADAKVLEDAQKYADEAITALVDSAPDAMNTLNELAEAIKGNEDIYKAYVEEHAQAMTKMKEDLQKEIDDDVKAVVDAQKLVNDAQAETNENFEGRIAANEAFVAAQPAVDAEQDRRIKALEDANAEGGAMAEAVQAAQKAADDAQAAAEAAQGAADAAQADVDAVEKRLDDEGGLVDRIEAVEGFVQGHSHEGLQGEIDALEGRADALEAFVEAHDHSVMEKGIADNKAAIEKEVKDRDDAIAAALEAYANEEEVKGMLTSVINSLGLSIVDNKLQLTLGTSDFVIKEVELDMATDADIDAIIAGLDTPAGE